MLCINRPFFCCLNICQITCIRHLLSLSCMDYCNSLQISLHTPALSLIHSRVVCSLLRVTLLKSKSEPIPTQLKTSSDFLRVPTVSYTYVWPVSHKQASLSLFFVFSLVHSTSLAYLVHTKPIPISGPLNLISLPGALFLWYPYGYIQISAQMLFYERGPIILCLVYSALYFFIALITNEYIIYLLYFFIVWFPHVGCRHNLFSDVSLEPRTVP